MTDPPTPRGPGLDEPVLFERGSPGRRGYTLRPLTESERAAGSLAPELCRDDLEDFPELSEMEVLRHFLRLSQWNYSAATNFYPLGSCTMKYNPILNEKVARLAGFADLHPLTPPEASQGALELMAELERMLAEVSGMDAVSLQPAAGAHGELTGMKMIRAHHVSHGRPRRKVLIPQSAHGTNPASSALCGYQVVAVASNDEGMIDTAAVSRLADGETAAIMVTNPNTLGLFERDIARVAATVHDKGGARVPRRREHERAPRRRASRSTWASTCCTSTCTRPSRLRTAAAGPGAGPVAVERFCAPYLPDPACRARRPRRSRSSEDAAEVIGNPRRSTATSACIVRAYAYMITLGGDGMTRGHATWPSSTRITCAGSCGRLRRSPRFGRCMHECVFSDSTLEQHGIQTLDLAKRLIDYGFHPPTIYFPLIVPDAIMIEPTETETRETLDEFAAAVRAIVAEAREDPERVKSAPHRTRVSRLDEVRAARQPRLRWRRTAPP